MKRSSGRAAETEGSAPDSAMRRPSVPVRSNAPSGQFTNIADPPASTIHGTGTRPPCVRSWYPPCPLRVPMIDPRRSNCGPPCPSPSSGPLIANVSAPVAASMASSCTRRPPFAEIVMRRGRLWPAPDGGTSSATTVSSPLPTRCSPGSSRSRAAGTGQARVASAPVSGIAGSRPSSSARMLRRVVMALAGVMTISTGRPAMVTALVLACSSGRTTAAAASALIASRRETGGVTTGRLRTSWAES